MSLSLLLLPGFYAVCRLAPDSAIPEWVGEGELSCITRTADELSVLCEQGRVPAGIKMEKGFRALKVNGPLDFAMVGVIARISRVLAEAGVSIFVVSTFDTDYVLIKEAALDTAFTALERAGIGCEGW